MSPLENVSTNLSCGVVAAAGGGALPWGTFIVGFFNEGTTTKTEFPGDTNQRRDITPGAYEPAVNRPTIPAGGSASAWATSFG